MTLNFSLRRMSQGGQLVRNDGMWQNTLLSRVPLGVTRAENLSYLLGGEGEG